MFSPTASAIRNFESFVCQPKVLSTKGVLCGIVYKNRLVPTAAVYIHTRSFYPRAGSAAGADPHQSLDYVSKRLRRLEGRTIVLLLKYLLLLSNYAIQHSPATNPSRVATLWFMRKCCARWTLTLNALPEGSTTISWPWDGAIAWTR